MKILKISIIALGTSLCGLAQADMIGVKGDLSYWNYNGEANIAAQTSAPDQELDRKGQLKFLLHLSTRFHSFQMQKFAM